MAYTITLTNGNILTTVPDTQLMSTYGGLDLIGKNYAGFGTVLNNNLAHIIENFADSVPPTNPFVGQIWYDTVSESIKFWNGTAFKDISVITASAVEPLYPQEGDEWFNGSALYIWNGYEWVLIGPPSAINGGKEGWVVANVSSGGNSVYYLQLWANEELMAVFSAVNLSASVVGLAGFGDIRAGINFVSSPDSSANIPSSGIYNTTEITIGLNDELLLAIDGNSDVPVNINGYINTVASSQANSTPAYANLVSGNINGSLFTNNLFANNTIILNNTSIGGNLSVDGTTTIDGTLTVYGETILEQSVSIGQTLSVAQSLSVGTDTTINGNLYVSGFANLAVANIAGEYTLPVNNGSIMGAPLVTNNDGTTQWLNNANIMQFANNNMATNGYQYLPGGLLLQWMKGSTDIPATGRGTFSESWPIPFPNACFHVQTTVVLDNTLSGSSAQQYGIYVQPGSNKTSVSMYYDVGPDGVGDTTHRVFMFGIGN